ncbi:VCBS repeat-containing protein [bacterium]|nr:VCBS repeat-containing protein [bacterium]
MEMFEIHLVDSVKAPYTVEVADMNGNGMMDIVVGSTGDYFIAWYESPFWKKHIIGTNTRGNISAAAHDIDGDGKLEVAVCSEFNMGVAKDAAYLQWFDAVDDQEGEWVSYKIDDLSFAHGGHFADIDGDGKDEFVVGTMRGTISPEALDWEDPGLLVYYKIPENPREDRWIRHVIDDKVKRLHNKHIIDLDGDGHLDIIAAAKDGVLWYERNTEDGEFKKHIISDHDAGNVFVVDLDGDGVNEVVSLEAWHGTELVWYKAPGDLRAGKWTRHVIDDTFENAHAVCCADMNNDGKIEIVAGFRGTGTSLNYYEPIDVKANKWNKYLIDDDMGITGVVAMDIDGDDKLDIVGAGQTTNTLKWYRNLM